ncbi:hypothetical protein H257_00467 [Aphanomyces astaci]|uniref:PX domain-containing protein n=1 Tax=Aphanomyces astaci TaxID=112090 RepID=W4HCT6_APHAT|nr:hypothetical protein H257_00467 [Aphanomyces astaci]ETV89084.1 hypothetical protein H257_00467 [Aphanomyces astaci]|eukprot:XP_009821484.1 hypothetical protein H257_00467 [Aphanomyces astaci]
MGCKQSTTAADPAAISQAHSPPHSASSESTNAAVIVDHSIDEKGVVLYHVEAYGVAAKKRFNDFKTFHHDIQLVVPPMPEAGFFTALNRRDLGLIQARRLRFQDIIRAAPRDRVVLFLDPNANVVFGGNDVEKTLAVETCNASVPTD